jgi:hypothetical protein
MAVSGPILFCPLRGEDSLILAAFLQLLYRVLQTRGVLNRFLGCFRGAQEVVK